jgi:ferrous-iron efflux pump FieF
LAWIASGRFDHRHEPTALNATFYVALFAAAVTFALITYMGRVALRTRSTVIIADRIHYMSDFGGNLLLCAGFFIARFWHAYNIDAILTLVLCLFIFQASVSILRDAVKHLVDHSDPDTETHVAKVIQSYYPETLGASRIRSRRSGRRTSVDIELLSCRRLPFQAVHDIAHKVEESLLTEDPHLDIVIHSEPCTDATCAVSCRLQVESEKSR